MKECVLLIILGIYSYWDIREKQLPVIWLAIGMMVSVVQGLGEILDGRNIGVPEAGLELFFRMLPGIVLFVVAFAAKGKVGYGDGFLMAVIGLTEGVNRMMRICMVSLGMSFVYSCILVVFRGKNKEYIFPFAPFCFLGTAIMVLIEHNLR